MTVGELVGASASVFLVAVLSAGAAYVLGGLWLAWWLLIDPTLRDQLAKTIHDAVCRCDYFPDRHPATCNDYLAAADKAAELLTAPRFPDGWERGHEAKYWAQTGLTPYGLTLDPERAPGVLNWLGVNYYTPDSPHLPASAAAPVVLPTVGEVREAIIAGTKLGGWMPHTAAQAVLDLIASRVRHWVPVEPGTVIKAGTRLREDWDDQIAEWTLGEDQDPYQNCGRRCRYYIDPATVPAEPEDQRIKRAHAIIPALQRVKNVPLGGDLLPAALEAIDAIDALEADR